MSGTGSRSFRTRSYFFLLQRFIYSKNILARDGNWTKLSNERAKGAVEEFTIVDVDVTCSWGVKCERTLSEYIVAK